MANVDQPFGLRPAYHPTGDIRQEAFVGGIVSGFAQSIYRGDPVSLDASGLLLPAAIGTRLYGVFWGCQYDDSTGKPRFSNYWPASTVATNIIAYVPGDPQIVSEVQVPPNFSITDIGANCDILYTSGTGIGYSRVEAESVFESSTMQLRVVDMVRKAGVESGTNAKILVRLNETFDNTNIGI